MLFKLSNLNSNLALTLGYLNPALNNSALEVVHWAKSSYSAVLQASTTSKLYEISMAWIVKCYQVRSQSLKTTTAGTHAREKTQP